jgi:AraC-like DNA-binding protein
MFRELHPREPRRLERSCADAPRDWIRLAPPQLGFERLEASFAGHGFDPHRHDTYAIGLTLCGVQAFDYRGATARSRCGQVVVLHPDELHDGRAEGEAGFRYRIAYIEPRLILDAPGERQRPLPFVADPVSDDARLAAAIAPALEDLDAPLEDLERDQVLVDVAAALTALDRSAALCPISAVCLRAIWRARELLDASDDHAVSSERLESATGLSRYALARQFRAHLGTSPHRYSVLRRLDRARSLIGEGVQLADAAVASGFADQSHMTRQFKRAYGMSPGRWRAMLEPMALAGMP